MDTQTQIERLIELAIVQRTELKELVAQLPQLREHLSTEIEKAFDEAEPQLRAELEEWTTKQAADKTAALGVTLEAKIADLAKSLEVSTQARYNAIIAEREENARLAAQAEAKIAEHAASLPSAVKEIVSAELARFPRAGEIDQLRKEFAEPRGLNPRGKWQAGDTYNKLDLVTINGDSYTSNTDGNRTRPSRSSADWTLVAARGTGGGGGPTSLSELTTVPSDGDLLIGSGTSWVTSNLTAGAGISITVGPGAITISATDGDITLDDGTAASPSLHFTNDPDTGIYRPAANTLGISTSGVQRMYVDEDGITTVGAGGTFDGSVHAANGNANNPSFSFTSDQDTGFYRHGTNELGISIGGTEKAVMTSTTFSITPNVSISGNLTVSGYADLGSGGIGTPAAGHIQIGGSGSYGAAIIGRGSAYDFGLFNKNGDDVIHVATGTTNVAVSGNLTVSGTGTTGGNLRVRNALGYATGIHTGTTSDSTQQLLLSSNAAYNHAYISKGSTTLGIGFSSDNGSFVADDSITITAATKLVTLTGNLTVSGAGTNGFKAVSLSDGATYGGLTLNGAIASGTMSGIYGGGDSNLYATAPTSVWILTAGTERARFTSTATILANNLTVSGGGATFGASGGGDAVLSLKRASDGLTVGNLTVNTSSSLLNLGTAYTFLTFSTEGTEKARFSASTGNFLLKSDGQDSGNGKLQLATHTSYTGGIGFGADTSLYRSQTGMLALDGLTGSLSQLDLRVGGVQKAFVAWNGGDFYLGAVVGTTVIRSSNTTALTLDSSQNATFAGTLTLPNDKAIYFKEVSGTAQRFALNSGDVIYIEPDQLHKISIGGSGVTNVGVGGIGVAGNSVFAGTVTTTGLITVTGTTASIANGATADITLNTPSSLVSYYVRSEGNSNDQSSGFYRSNNNGASSAFVLFGQSEANVAVTTPAAGTIRITNNTGGTIAFAYAFTVLVKR